ncbi:Sn1-specific diacylglycerol lipase beta, partial [Zootermopsis nevadensis]
MSCVHWVHLPQDRDWRRAVVDTAMNRMYEVRSESFKTAPIKTRTLISGVMPSLTLFGRKWLVASDDLVFPGIFEFVFRFIWLILLSLACARYFPHTWFCSEGGVFVRVYMIGVLTILACNIVLLVPLVNRSAQGAILDTAARRVVAPILTVKY